VLIIGIEIAVVGATGRRMHVTNPSFFLNSKLILQETNLLSIGPYGINSYFFGLIRRTTHINDKYK
jgi:hypothetical protein